MERITQPAECSVTAPSLSWRQNVNGRLEIGLVLCHCREMSYKKTPSWRRATEWLDILNAFLKYDRNLHSKCWGKNTGSKKLFAFPAGWCKQAEISLHLKISLHIHLERKTQECKKNKTKNCYICFAEQKPTKTNTHLNSSFSLSGLANSPQ